MPGRFGKARNGKLPGEYSEAKIFPAVEALIVKLVKADSSKVSPEARFIQDLGCDSLTMVEIVMSCEDRFCIEIGERAGSRIKSVQNLMDVVKAALAERKRRG